MFLLSWVWLPFVFQAYSSSIILAVHDFWKLGLTCWKRVSFVGIGSHGNWYRTHLRERVSFVGIGTRGN